ncbi:Outer membrane protein assembly factor BamB [Pararobbsia alpina]|uniref:outer membrane protein assembly factor BamB n=1 Tax=Pararobbsia alpina TaxID=621374 RepID=UPI0039A4A873
MGYPTKVSIARAAQWLGSAVVAVSLASVLAACSSHEDPRREPTPLTDFKPTLDVKQVWSASVGKAGKYLFQPVAVGNDVFAAGRNGSVIRIDATSGKTIWSIKVDDDLSAGVGSDGNLTAVGGLDGTVYVLGKDGKQLWKANASGEIVTPPLVGNGYVLVRTIDGRITAFNADTGEQKWSFRNRSVPLNLRTTVGMTFAGGTAVLAGFPGGSLAAINLETGDAYWQTPVSYPTGVTEVERINDVAGAPTLVGRETCAVTFQGRIGCFEAESGRPVWEQPFSSYGGLTADQSAVISTNDWSEVSLYDAANGQRVWQNSALKSRTLTAPTIIGNAVAVGDAEGYLHFLARDTGVLVARVKANGSGISAPAVVAGDTVVVQARDGDIYAYRAQ